MTLLLLILAPLAALFAWLLTRSPGKHRQARDWTAIRRTFGGRP